MLIERLVWQAKFGQGDAVVAAFKDFRDRLAPQYGIPAYARILVDATGPMFTVVVDTEYPDMESLARAYAERGQHYASADFHEWFGTWTNAVERGTRELYRVID
jgi:hypothetical protein